MKHIRKFETTAGFEAARPSLALPNVSLVTQTNTINYLPYGGSEPEWVEINGVKWATKNLGAATILDAGLYYQWGDTQGYTVDQAGEGEGKKHFGKNDYKYYDVESEHYTKYNISDGPLVLEASDDAATAALGANWKIPTYEDVQSLIDACTVEYWQQYPIYGPLGPQDAPIASGPGYLFIDNNDWTKTLFFPISGYMSDIYGYDQINSNVWTNTISVDNYGEVTRPYSLLIFGNNVNTVSTDLSEQTYPENGLPIRPVYTGS